VRDEPASDVAEVERLAVRATRLPEVEAGDGVRVEDVPLVVFRVR
jgi:hypothetical protein